MQPGGPGGGNVIYVNENRQAHQQGIFGSNVENAPPDYLKLAVVIRYTCCYVFGAGAIAYSGKEWTYKNIVI